MTIAASILALSLVSAAGTSTRVSAGSMHRVLPSASESNRATTAQNLAAVMLHESTIEWYRERGQTRCWAPLERAPGGCAAELSAYARAFSEAGEVYGLDPWLLVALAWHESRWVAGANGAADERSILQIHPRNRNARGLAVFDDREWLVCRKQIGSCQYEVIFTAAAMLAAARDRCGSMTGAIAAWNTGRCTSERGVKYAARVMRTRDRFAKGGSA